MVNKGNHPLLWPYFRLVNYYNLPIYIYIYTHYIYGLCTPESVCFVHLLWGEQFQRLLGGRGECHSVPRREKSRWRVDESDSAGWEPACKIRGNYGGVYIYIYKYKYRYHYYKYKYKYTYKCMCIYIHIYRYVLVNIATEFQHFVIIGNLPYASWLVGMVVIIRCKCRLI